MSWNDPYVLQAKRRSNLQANHTRPNAQAISCTTLAGLCLAWREDRNDCRGCMKWRHLYRRSIGSSWTCIAIWRGDLSTNRPKKTRWSVLQRMCWTHQMWEYLARWDMMRSVYFETERNWYKLSLKHRRFESMSQEWSWELSKDPKIHPGDIYSIITLQRVQIHKAHIMHTSLLF